MVVRSTRVPSGLTYRNNEVNDDKLGFVAALEFNPAKSRVLLQQALLVTKDPEGDPADVHGVLIKGMRVRPAGLSVQRRCLWPERSVPGLPCAFALAALLFACAPQASERHEVPEATYDGLRLVASKFFEVAYVRPGVDFRRYRELRVRDYEVAFRTPDRSKLQFPLTDEQKTRLHDLLESQFTAEFVNLKNLKVTSTSGPEVLDLGVRLQDIVATVPPRSAGRSGNLGIALDAVGEVTLVMELRDAESGEVLARVFDPHTAEGVASMQRSGAVTSWEDIDEVCRHWAVAARQALDVVVSGTLAPP